MSARLRDRLSSRNVGLWLASAVLGGGLGVLLHALFLGWIVFLVAPSVVALALDLRSRRARFSLGPGSASGDWVAAKVRRAGIHEARDSGRGRILDEPILVSCSGAAVRGAGEVYDQHGRLLATGAKHREEGERRFGLGEMVHSVVYVDPSGATVLRVSPDRRWNPKFFRAIAPDGRELGDVWVGGRNEGRVTSGVDVVGWLRPGRRRFLSAQRFGVIDANEADVGRITRDLKAAPGPGPM